MNKLTVDLDNLKSEERDQLLALVKKSQKPKWAGPKGDWVIQGNGKVYNLNPTDLLGGTYQQAGHCGETEEQAKYIRDQLTHYAWMLHAWLEVVGDWRPNWDDTASKYYIYYYSGGFGVNHRKSSREPHGFYFPTKQQANQWAEMVGERIKELGV